MNNFYLLLAVISFALLVIGLIKPSAFSRFIKSPSRKKLFAIFGTTTFILYVLFGLTYKSKYTEPEIQNVPEVQKTQEMPKAQENQQLENVQEIVEEEEVIYELDAWANVENDNIRIVGKTNLPDNSALEVSAHRMFTFFSESDLRNGLVGRGYENVTVFDGRYETVLTLDDRKFLEYIQATGEKISLEPNIKIKVVFNPKQNQSSEVLSIVGKNGEKLESSSNVKILGSLTDSPYNTLEFITETPFEFPFKDVLIN
jgi:hypothetical protein